MVDPFKVRPQEGNFHSPFLVRARMDPRSQTEYEPTRVLFVRGISATMTESEFVEICSEVGVVIQIFMLRNKGQAFVEYDSLEAADLCLIHFSRNPKMVSGNQLFFSYSGRHQITKKPHEQPQPSTELILNITNVCYPVTVDVLSKIFSQFGKLKKCKILPRSFGSQAIIELETLEGAIGARTGLDGKNIYNGCNSIRIEYSPMPMLRCQTETQTQANEEETSNVCFLHNMGEGITPDVLFNLFSLFGNVIKVKIFFKRRDMGLVQFDDHSQAQLAMNHLNNVPFIGRELYVSISKTSFVNIPANERQNNLCKDFTNYPFHRYKFQKSQDYEKAVGPSMTLRLSNLNADVEEFYYRQMFGDIVQNFQFLPGNKQALVKFPDLNSSIAILAVFQNRNIKGRFMKINFSDIELQ